MGINTVPHPPNSPDLAPCDFWLFPKLNKKLRGCRYETIEEMKVIDTLTHKNFHGAFEKLLERYKKCIAAGGNYFEGDSSFTCVLPIKVPIRKKVRKLIVCTSYLVIIIIIMKVCWLHGFLWKFLVIHLYRQVLSTIYSVRTKLISIYFLLGWKHWCVYE